MREHLDLDGDQRSGRLSRRAVLRMVLLGAGASTLSGVLAACAPQQPASAPAAKATEAPKPAGAAPTAAAKTAEAPKPAEAAKPAAPAPAAAKPAEAAKPAAATTGGAAPAGGQISMHWAKPVTFNTLFSTAGSEQGVERLMFGALVRVNDKLEAVPDLAEKVDVTPDAKTFTFTLRKGLTFTDGKPLTAQDVRFTIERAVDKRTASYWRGRLLDIQGAVEFGDQKAEKIAGLEIPDDHTVKMTLKNPDSTFLLTLGDFSGLSILPAHILKDVAPDQLQKHPFSLNPNVSGGAFQFVKYETDQYLELKRNDTYGGTKAKLDRIFFKVLAPDAALAQMERGELDLMIVPVAEMDRLKRNTNVSIVSVPSPSIDFLAINMRRDYLQDKRVRQAMQYAIDREAIVKAIFQGEAQIVNQTIVGPDWMGMPDLNMYKFDPGKSRQLLKDANWDSGRQLEAIYVPGAKERDAYFPMIQQLFKDVGITIQILPIEQAEFIRRRNINEFDMSLVGGGIFRQDPNVSSKYMETVNFVPVGGNYGHYSNPKIDELFAAGRATTDQAQRKKIYTEAATILNDELPWVYLWSPNSIFAHSKRLVGFKAPSYATHNMWNADEWSVAG